MSIAYFAHELADPAVERRLRMLAAAGRDVTLLGFERERGGQASTPPGAYVLGKTQNRRLLRRVLSVLLAAPRALSFKSAWRDADLLIARNLEMLVLVVFLTRVAKPDARIVYECLDIHRLMFARGWIGATLRVLERACLRRVALIVTSSPAFEQRHFREAQNFAGPVLLAENKVLDLDVPMTAPPLRRRVGAPWVIAWCGVLRCRRSFELLLRLARSHPDSVRIEMWGSPALDQIPEFHAAVADVPNMTFHGRYAARQLPAIYSDAHFAWAADFYEAGGNSDLLLPNRLYESLSFGAVPIAVDGVETARWLKGHDVGVVLEAPIGETLPLFFNGLTEPAFASLQSAVSRLDPELTRATPGACRAFAAQLAGQAA